MLIIRLTFLFRHFRFESAYILRAKPREAYNPVVSLKSPQRMTTHSEVDFYFC